MFIFTGYLVFMLLFTQVMKPNPILLWIGSYTNENTHIVK